jgi:hypothetical protein
MVATTAWAYAALPDRARIQENAPQHTQHPVQLVTNGNLSQHRAEPGSGGYEATTVDQASPGHSRTVMLGTTAWRRAYSTRRVNLITPTMADS